MAKNIIELLNRAKSTNSNTMAFSVVPTLDLTFFGNSRTELGTKIQG